MRALTLSSSGATPEISDVPVPVPTDGELLVRVHAASVNGFDLAVAAGYLEGMMEHRYPVVLGKDFAGVVEAIGAGVEAFAAGDRVFGVVTKPFLGDGSFGELVSVPASVGVAALPQAVSFVEGAALGLAGTAAATAVDAARIAPGHTVLIVGATGGVGTQAVQRAARAGATVIATAHTEAEQALVRELGAQHTVDHTGDLASAVRSLSPDGVDTVLHFAGDAGSVLPLVRTGGTFVSTLLGSADELPSDTVTVAPVYANPTPEMLDRLAAAQADGSTTVTVQQTYPLEQTATALADFGKGTAGKLVIEIA